MIIRRAVASVPTAEPSHRFEFGATVWKRLTHAEDLERTLGCPA